LATIPTSVRLAIAGGLAAFLALLVVAILLLNSAGGGGGGIDDPEDVRSISHKVGEESRDNVIRMEWTPEPGARAYSVEFSRLPEDVPDDVADYPGEESSAESRPLPAASWYFHMRTQGEDGGWTSTVHVGPFVIVRGSTSPTPTVEPEETEEPTDTPEPTDEPIETEEPTPEPTAPPTEAPTPPPTPEPTAAPTDTPTPSASPAPSPTS
jgi:hypothetical protein